MNQCFVETQRSSTFETNKEIAYELNPINFDDLEHLFLHLRTNYKTISKLSRKYNDIADFFTYEERLNTIGIKGINFYDFYRYKKDNYKLENIKKYYENQKKISNVKMYKGIYNLYFGSVTNFSISNVLQVLQKYQPKHVLDPTCGFGNRLVGACALDVESYIGIDNNENLKIPLNDLKNFLSNHSKTKIQVLIENCLNINYSRYKYDCVFTSLPYYNTEIYGNKKQFNTKQEWNINFYQQLIKKTYEHLEHDGYFIINVPEKVYIENFVFLLGECHEKIELFKRKRNNSYCEYIYVWKKSIKEAKEVQS